MVIGNGMIATAFETYKELEGFSIFASGVSDSTLIKQESFDREKHLILDTLKTNPNNCFVYFSTCSIYDTTLSKRAYVCHKIAMETLIQKHATNFLIFRLSNPVGKTQNTHTVVNYFIEHITNKIPFEAWKHAARNILDIDHMFACCNEIIQQKLYTKSIVNIANPHNYPIPFIIKTIETHFKTKGIYQSVEKGGIPIIDISGIMPIFHKLNINFDGDYLKKILQKYYPIV